MRTIDFAKYEELAALEMRITGSELASTSTI